LRDGAVEASTSSISIFSPSSFDQSFTREPNKNPFCTPEVFSGADFP
jgi:hypothetical protein